MSRSKFQPVFPDAPGIPDSVLNGLPSSAKIPDLSELLPENPGNRSWAFEARLDDSEDDSDSPEDHSDDDESHSDGDHESDDSREHAGDDDSDPDDDHDDSEHHPDKPAHANSGVTVERDEDGVLHITGLPEAAGHSNGKPVFEGLEDLSHASQDPLVAALGLDEESQDQPSEEHGNGVVVSRDGSEITITGLPDAALEHGGLHAVPVFVPHEASS